MSKQDVPKHIRKAMNERQEYLIDCGWEFSGINLFKHKTIPYYYYTENQAFELTKNSELEVYCPGCGFPDMETGIYNNCRCRYQ